MQRNEMKCNGYYHARASSYRMPLRSYGVVGLPDSTLPSRHTTTLSVPVFNGTEVEPEVEHFFSIHTMQK